VPEFGFTGQRFEAGVGIYDYGARFYDPALGRFLHG
jgi:RHS repeat-associated protein